MLGSQAKKVGIDSASTNINGHFSKTNCDMEIKLPGINVSEQGFW